MNSIFQHPLTIVDVETTGAHGVNDRIIEIGIIRVENGIIVKKYESLINPQTYVNPFITTMTGITAEMLETAPTFEEIKEEVYSLFEDSFMVAHNVRFDYGFLKNEFKRLDINFSVKHFCSARLSRLLFPHYRRHNLDAIIERFQIVCNNRHRALGDAMVIYEFFGKLSDAVESVALDNALGRLFVRTSVPPELKGTIDTLPESPGVYLFYNKDGTLLYVGKSTNIRSRVISHFSGDYMAEQEATITAQTSRIEFHPTPGELGALLLESELIKKLQPMHNRQLRKHLEYTILRKKRVNGYDNVSVETVTSISPKETRDILGIFSSKTQAKSTLETLCDDFHLCPKLVGLEKIKGGCFNSKLGKCQGACLGKEPSAEYNERLKTAFAKTSIKDWKYSTPIMINEKHGENGEAYFVDNWCLIGKAKFDDAGLSRYEQLPENFDYDVYKILKNYIRNPNNRKHITRISDEKLAIIKDSAY